MKKVNARILSLLACATIGAGFPLFASAETASSGTTPELTAAQKEFMNWKFGLFLHFNMGTFVGKEWALGNEDPLLFKPDKLDCGQWADAAKAAGMKYAVLTAKHTEG